MSHGDIVTTFVSTGSNEFVQALLNAGYRWDTSGLTGDPNEIRVTFAGSGFSPSQASTLRIALGQWSAVADIHFAEVVGQNANDLSPREDAELLFALAPPGTLGGAGGYSGAPFDALTENNVYTNNGQSILIADLGRTYTRISSAATNNDQDCFDSNDNLTPAGFELVMHEVGHALGLKHPHDEGTANYQHYFPGVTPRDSTDVGDNVLNQKLWTIMSYNKQTIGYNAATPMAFDIAAIQTLYGARADASSGNDTYTIPTPGAATAWRCIWDTGGIDSIRYNGTYTNMIDLRPASLQNEYGGGGWVSYSNTGNTIGCGFTIAGDVTNAIADQNGVTGVIIENAYGGSGYDGITGNDVDNILDGGGGGDTMRGYGGSDTYYVDNTGDQVIEAAGGGTNDRVNTTLTSYTLGANVEFLDFQGPSTTSFTGNGNELDNTIQGFNGPDILNGRVGADRMRGYDGNDIYYVDNAGDVVSDTGGTIDRVNTTLSSYTLGAGIEVLDYQGPSSIAFTGTGNDSANTIQGFGGDDILDGKGGADLMRGYSGNDTFIVDDASDVVEAGDGANKVFASVSYALTTGQQITVLATTRGTGTGAINLTGNEKVQELYGNNGANTLDGMGGADTLTGFAGNDSYIVDQGADKVVEAAGGGTDTLYARGSYGLAAGQEIEVVATIRSSSASAINLNGNEFAQTLYGNAGANILDGKGGSDVLYGYGGADTFVFSRGLGASNIDRIADFSSADDTIRLAKNIFPVLPAGGLSQAAFKDLDVAGASVDADDRILYDHDKGRLYYDVDGSGAGGAVLFAILNNKATLSFQDFHVV